MRTRFISNPEHYKIEQQEQVAQEVPVLLKNFEIIKEKPPLHPKPEDIESSLQDVSDRQHCFEETKKAFLHLAQSDKLKQHLGLPENDDSFKYLKKVRRAGLVLKSAFRFFDKRHKSPEAFHLFMKALGNLNDQYFTPNRTALSQRLLLNEHVTKKLSDTNFLLSPASNQNFHEQVGHAINDIYRYIKQPSLTPKDFHSLRKTIRDCAGMVQIPAAEHVGENVQWLFASVLELSKELGDEHDKLVKLENQGKLSYKQRVNVDPSVKRRFIYLEPYIKKSAGLAA